MGPAYAISPLYLIVLTIPQFSSMSQYISALILVGMAKHKVLAYVTLAEGIANLLLSIILVRKIGLIGVAWGTVIPHAISTAVVIPYFTLHAVRMKWSDYVVKGFVRPIVAAIRRQDFVMRSQSGWRRFRGSYLDLRCLRLE